MSRALLAMLAACSVDRADLGERIFHCETDADCATGYGCQRADVGGSGHCAPLGEPCDGHLTAAGRCLVTCTIESPDSAVGCPPGLSCIRTDLLGDAGVCLDTVSCNTTADCPEDETCLAELLVPANDPIAAVARTDHTTCVRAGCSASPVICATDEICLASFRPELDFCAPRCTSAVPDACPPGFGCFAQQAPGGGRVCLPGLSGAGCAEDLDCLVSTCKVVTGEGHRQCALPCQLEDGLAVCEAHPRTQTGSAILEHCVERDGESLCVLHGNYTWECGEAADWQPCMEDVPCAELTDETGTGTGRMYCIDECQASQDCPEGAFCTPIEGSSMSGCREKKGSGQRCNVGDECLSGSCETNQEGCDRRCCTGS